TLQGANATSQSIPPSSTANTSNFASGNSSSGSNTTSTNTGTSNTTTSNTNSAATTNTRTQSPASCTPDPTSPQTQTLVCPAGQIGSIMQTRASSCTSGATAPSWSDWT